MGSILYLPKKYPTPRVRINPAATIDWKSYKFSPSPEIQRALEKIQAKLDDTWYDRSILEQEHIEDIDVD